MSRLKAMEQAAAGLAVEAAGARDMAAQASAACRGLVDQIVAAEARDLARQWIACVQLGWRLQDCLTGLVALGGDLLPRDFQENLLAQIDRRKAAVIADPQMLERPNYDDFLDRSAADQKRRWLDYGRRLMESSDSVFGEELPQ
jgi:hypothetical protein